MPEVELSCGGRDLSRDQKSITRGGKTGKSMKGKGGLCEMGED